MNGRRGQKYASSKIGIEWNHIAWRTSEIRNKNSRREPSRLSSVKFRQERFMVGDCIVHNALLCSVITVQLGDDNVEWSRWQREFDEGDDELCEAGATNRTAGNEGLIISCVQAG
jgi:hypothetical protein